MPKRNQGNAPLHAVIKFKISRQSPDNQNKYLFNFKQLSSEQRKVLEFGFMNVKK